MPHALQLLSRNRVQQASTARQPGHPGLEASLSDGTMPRPKDWLLNPQPVLKPLSIPIIPRHRKSNAACA